MVNLNRLSAFVAVVQAGSFTAAASQLGQSKAVVSFSLKQLEQELGVALLTRSTRRLAVTEAGQRFYQDCLRLLEEAELAIDEARKGHVGLNGSLRVTSTAEYGLRVVVPALAAFARAHPQLQIQHASSSLPADLISERFDVAIRLGQLRDSNYRAALIEKFEILPVAAPAYLQRHAPGRPDSLAALEQMQWLGHSRLPMPPRWQVQTPEDGLAMLEVETRSMIVADSADALRQFALHGAGVALLPQWLVAQDIRSKTLLHLLPGHRFPTQGVYAVYADTRHVPEKVRAFIDFLQAFVKT